MGYFNHVIRLGAVLLAVIVGFFVVRMFFVPESFGVYGSYTYGYHRGDSDREQADIPAVYQSTEKCAKCHGEHYADLVNGGHAPVACESCHGHWQAHNKNTRAKVVKDTSVAACMLCHEKLTGRPKDFPQIVSLARHVKDKGETVKPDALCVECHNPHAPEQ